MSHCQRPSPWPRERVKVRLRQPYSIRQTSVPVLEQLPHCWHDVEVKCLADSLHEWILLLQFDGPIQRHDRTIVYAHDHKRAIRETRSVLRILVR